MPPKKSQGGDYNVDSDPDDHHIEADLQKQIEELRQKLRVSEQQKEHQRQEAAHDRHALSTQYREQMDRVAAEKDDEIRNLLRANEMYRNIVRVNDVPQKVRDVPMPRQILFDGKITWESFSKPFRALVESCKWNQEESLFRLQSSLRGEAAEFAFNQTTAATLASYDNLMAALETRYKERRTSSSYLAELENRKLQPKEKLAEYVSEIRKLVIKGYPTADDVTRETINVRHFIKGLQDQQAALHIGMKDPKTIEEARTILVTYNSLKDEAKSGVKIREVKAAEKPKSAATDYVTESRLQSFGRDLKTSIGKKIDGLASQLNRSQPIKSQEKAPPVPRNSKNLGDVECYACGEMGHYARRCPSQNVDGKRVSKKEN